MQDTNETLYGYHTNNIWLLLPKETRTWITVCLYSYFSFELKSNRYIIFLVKYLKISRKYKQKNNANFSILICSCDVYTIIISYMQLYPTDISVSFIHQCIMWRWFGGINTVNNMYCYRRGRQSKLCVISWWYYHPFIRCRFITNKLWSNVTITIQYWMDSIWDVSVSFFLSLRYVK